MAAQKIIAVFHGLKNDKRNKKSIFWLFEIHKH